MDSGNMASPFNAANVIKQLRSRKSSISSMSKGPSSTQDGAVRSSLQELNKMVSVSAKQEKSKKANEKKIKMDDGGGKFEEDELDFYRRLIIKGGGEGGGGQKKEGEMGRAKPQVRKAERSKFSGVSRDGRGNDDSDSSWSDYDEEEENLRVRGKGKGEGKGKWEGKGNENEDEGKEEEEEGGEGFKDQLKGLVEEGQAGGGGDGFDSDSLDFDTSTDSEPTSRPKNHPIQYQNSFDDFADDLSDDLDDLSDPEDDPNENVNPGPISIAALEDEIDEQEVKRIYEERLARAGIEENKMENRAMSPGDSPTKKKLIDDNKIDFSKSLPSPLKMKQQQQQQQMQQQQVQQRSRLRQSVNRSNRTTPAGGLSQEKPKPAKPRSAKPSTSRPYKTAATKTTNAQDREQNFSFDMKPGQRMRIMKKSKLSRGGGLGIGEDARKGSFNF